jgi:hypothetical protein
MTVDDVSVDSVNVNRSTRATARGSAGPTCQPHAASLTSRAHAVWRLGSSTRSVRITAQGERAGSTARELSSAWWTGPAGYGGPSSCSFLLLCFFCFSFISLTVPVPLVGLLLLLTRRSHVSEVVGSARLVRSRVA